MTIEWKEWNDKIIEKVHGNVLTNRKLYAGDFIELSPRLRALVEEQTAYDPLDTKNTSPNVKTPIVTANVAKLIPEVPAMLVSRSMGKVKSSLTSTAEQNETTGAADDMIEGPDKDIENDTIDDLQQELIDQISKNSRLQLSHWQNIVQHQVDGGIVGVPVNDDRGLRLDFKMRDLYFPHDDDMGIDLAYKREFDEEEYLHIYRERVEVERDEKKRKYKLRATNLLFLLEGDNTVEVDEATAKELLGLETLEIIYEGRSSPFIVYWANEPTFHEPYGRSSLEGQISKQDEINWTLTKGSIVFTKNSDPKIAVSQEIFQTAQNKAYEKYGEEGIIDHRDLNIVTYDQNGKALELIQLDISKIGTMTWVKDLMKMMFIETKTSEKAVDFYMDGGGTGGESGIAKFYDLFISIVKSEQIQQEYIYFLQQLFENCLWLANREDPNVIIEEPEITLNSMIPISRKELIEENNLAFAAGTQSLETTIRRNNPHASEEWIEEELVRIEEAAQSDDSTSLLVGRQTLTNLQDNRDAEGNVIEDDKE